jgi:hypothetical protein
MKKDLACEGIRTEVTLSERVPVAAETVVADAGQAARRRFHISDLHPAICQEGKLLSDAFIRLGISVEVRYGRAHKRITGPYAFSEEGPAVLSVLSAAAANSSIGDSNFGDSEWAIGSGT